MLNYERFDFDFFIVWLLPPIIFEAGFNMDVHSFFANIYPTIFFAFVGTFASTFIIGGLVWGMGQLGLCYPMGLLASLSFGSVISATDPVTVLSVFQATGHCGDTPRSPATLVITCYYNCYNRARHPLQPLQPCAYLAAPAAAALGPLHPLPPLHLLRRLGRPPGDRSRVTDV